MAIANALRDREKKKRENTVSVTKTDRKNVFDLFRVSKILEGFDHFFTISKK